MTAVILIATKECPEYAVIHSRMWDAMQKMLLQITLGATEVRTVGSVEGLLILAEWVPHANAPSGLLNASPGPTATEDTAAWTLVGLAVRQAYLLHLDKYAFRGESAEGGDSSLSRKRLAWTCTVELTIGFKTFTDLGFQTRTSRTVRLASGWARHFGVEAHR
jgi:hypothetical protein